MPAKIIMFDGPDGVGKTTQLKMAADRLEKSGKSLLLTRINGGSPIGEEIRKAYLSPHDRPVETDMHLALALAYALGQHLQELEGIDIVLVDRSPYSILAYQAFASGLDLDKAKAACELSAGATKPDLVLIYDAPLEILQSRRVERAVGIADYFEDKGSGYHERLRQGYAYAAKTYKLPVIRATGTPDAIHGDTMDAIEAILD